MGNRPRAASPAGRVVVAAAVVWAVACSGGSDNASTTSPPSSIHQATTVATAAPEGTAPADSVATDSALTGAAPGGVAGLEAVIEEITSKPELRHANFGFAVVDAASGDVLFELNGDKLFVTGSLLKSFPTTTLLDKWGPDYRFHTPVYGTGPVDAGAITGDLVLVASGDTSMGLREQPDGTLYFDDAPVRDHTYANSIPGGVPVAGDPLAGLDSLAQQVAAAGVTTVTGDVIIDDRLFNTFSGWPFAEESPVSPIVINDNLIDVTVTPAAMGEAATFEYRPQTSAYTVRSEVQTVASGAETDIAVRLAEPGVFVATGQIAADSTPITHTGAIPDPAPFARTAFIEALQRAGVSVAAAALGPNRIDALPPEGSYAPEALLGEHVSGPLSEITKVVMKMSQNTGADVLACLNAVAAGSKDCPAGLAAESEYAASLGLPKDALFILDGAGADGYVTPLGIARFYDAVLDQPYAEAFRESLAVLGVDGDLAEEAFGTPAAGHIAAKTGTLGDPTPSGVGIFITRTLAGYAEAASGRQIVLAVFMGGGAPFETIDDLRGVVEDHTELVVAVQQAF